MSEVSQENQSISPESEPSYPEHDTHHEIRQSPEWEAFITKINAESQAENKLHIAIDFMETALGQGKTPHFRHFWEARRLCLPLFKENVNPIVRSQLWNKYSELSKEARRLKDLLDEQSAFAVEQIEIAIKALEIELETFDEQLKKQSVFEDVVFPYALADKQTLYQDLQKQLNFLNTHATRINALRKELLKTEMRVRHKNKFFQRLSAAGDTIFPRRKELIKNISQQFTTDVDEFIENHFSNESVPHGQPNHILREEIKLLQGLAKILTLNTHAFTQTRLRLSECWDQLKVEEKERKKERAQQRAVSKQHADEVMQSITKLKQEIDTQQKNQVAAKADLDAIVVHMRQVHLDKQELNELREALSEVRKAIQEQLRTEENARQHQENEKVRQRKEFYKDLKQRVEHLLQTHDSLDTEELIAQRDQIQAQVAESHLSKTEKQELERCMRPLKDMIVEKKEKALLNLSEDDRQSLQQLQDILKQRKARRQEIKNQIEVYRKGAGASGFDFEKALAYTSQIDEERERLEKINQGIREIEEKIAQLQSNIK